MGAEGVLNIFTMLYVISFIICIIAGIISWGLIEPENFGQAVVFLVVWAILTTIGYSILEAIYRTLNDG